jgi:hypothetical protein
MRTSLFNGQGTEASNSWIHVPAAYAPKFLPKNKQLTIIELSKKKVVVALRNGSGFTIGMMKHLPLLKNKIKGSYFEYKGKKIFLKDVSPVF